MCIGIPMRVREVDAGVAVCKAPDGALRRVNALLVAEVATGDMLLVHAGHAVRRLDEDEAKAIAEALQALDLAMSETLEPDAPAPLGFGEPGSGVQGRRLSETGE